MGDWIVFPLLTGKGLGLPRFCRKAAPFGGLVGQKKIILATLRYFLLPSLAQSPTKDSQASKKTKIRLHGADHVKLKKIKV